MPIQQMLLGSGAGGGIAKDYWFAILGGNTAGGGQTTHTQGNDIAVDSEGNVYVTGYTRCTPSGNMAVVTAKYSESGSLEWQRLWGSVPPSGFSSTSDEGFGITVDGSDNIYVVGHADSHIGGYSGKGALILKYNTSGTLQWERTIGKYDSEAYGVDFDSSGNIYVCGRGQYSNWQFISKLNSSGTLQWYRGFSSPKPPNRQGDKANDIVVDRNNNVVYICGHLTTSGYQYDMTLAKYNLSGTIQWQRSLSGDFTSGQDFAYGVSVDSSGNVYVIGRATQLASSNPGGQGNNNQDGFIVKWSSGGYVSSKITFGGYASEDGTGIVIDSQDNVFAVGMSDSGNTTSGVGSRGLIMRLTSSLSSTWARSLGNISSAGYNEEGTKKVAVDHQRVAIYTVGTIRGTGPGYDNIIISKLPPDGTGTGTYNSPHLPYVSDSYGGVTSTFSTSINYSPGFTDSNRNNGQQTPSGSNPTGNLTSTTYAIP